MDAQSSQRQELVEDLADLEPIMTRSCGYLVHEDKNRIVLCFMLFDSEEQRQDVSSKHWQVIPRGMVRKIRKLKRR